MQFPAPRLDHSSSQALAPRDGGIAPDPGWTQSLRQTSRQPRCGPAGLGHSIQHQRPCWFWWRGAQFWSRSC